ncbi:hypothetical protein Tco_0296055 [Tanacetum coccineum]|uniref:Uncharacterized protein n=1 Tax=Tanacetum coccineum TaxID=301880 RepID=A0ABQ5H8M3_9ASTR
MVDNECSSPPPINTISYNNHHIFPEITPSIGPSVKSSKIRSKICLEILIEKLLCRCLAQMSVKNKIGKRVRWGVYQSQKGYQAEEKQDSTYSIRSLTKERLVWTLRCTDLIPNRNIQMTFPCRMRECLSDMEVTDHAQSFHKVSSTTWFKTDSRKRERPFSEEIKASKDEVDIWFIHSNGSASRTGKKKLCIANLEARNLPYPYPSSKQLVTRLGLEELVLRCGKVITSARHRDNVLSSYSSLHVDKKPVRYYFNEDYTISPHKTRASVLHRDGWRLGSGQRRQGKKQRLLQQQSRKTTISRIFRSLEALLETYKSFGTKGTIPTISAINWRDLPRDNPLVSVDVLGYLNDGDGDLIKGVNSFRQTLIVMHFFILCKDGVPSQDDTTAWNEFSSIMASAIICLVTNQKFNFSKYIFKSMVKNLDNAGKVLMYPRKPKRKDTQIPQSSGPTDNVADKAVNEEMDDSLERVATIATSLDAEQDRAKNLKLIIKLLKRLHEDLTDDKRHDCLYISLGKEENILIAKRVAEKRNRPPARAQQGALLYLSEIHERIEAKNLKNKSFTNIQELFDKAMKRVNTFIDYITELVEESSKKAKAEIA